MQLRSPVSINQWMLWFMVADVSHCCALGGLAAQKCVKQTANRSLLGVLFNKQNKNTTKIKSDSSLIN